MKQDNPITPEELKDDPNLRTDNPKIVPVRSPRLTIVGNIYHQIPGEDIAGPSPSRYYRWIESEEQAYKRTLKVGTEWQPLDLGWFKDKEEHGLLSLANGTKRLPSRKPSAQEEQEFYEQILEVGIEYSDGKVMEIAYLPVGEDMRLPPLNLDKYRIRCRTKETKYSIFVVPV